MKRRSGIGPRARYLDPMRKGKGSILVTFPLSACMRKTGEGGTQAAGGGRGARIALADRHWPVRPADHLEALSIRHVAHFLRTGSPVIDCR